MTQINLKSHTISALGGALSLMEDFKKNLLKMGKTNRTVPAILLIAAVFFLLFGIFMIPHKDQPLTRPPAAMLPSISSMLWDPSQSRPLTEGL